ncbi:MAG: response regulator [Deltaproteobacteria bacterium]|nr:response regulator [Deltaproteobacteria bacterium]
MHINNPKKEITVLLVEDSESITLQIQLFLAQSSRYKFELIRKSTLADSIEYVSQNCVNVIILDLGLPDSNGISTFFKLQRKAPNVATVVFTGESDEQISLEALRYGAQDYLIKGQVDSKLLIKAIIYAIERKNTEEKLRISESKHRKLLEAMPDIIYRLDENGVITYINPSIKRLGYDPEELTDKHFSTLFHPDDLPNISRNSVLPPLAGVVTGHSNAPRLIDERRTGDRMTKNLMLRLIPKNWTPNDEKTCVFASLTSYGEITATGQYSGETESGDKKFIGTVGIIKDVTDRKRAEDDKQALEEQLRQSQKMEAIGQLAGGIAHDINNVLGAIQSSASVVELEMLPDNMHKLDIENILTACKKGRDLTRDLLGFARKGKYVKESLSLNKIAREVESLLFRTLKKKISLKVNLESELPYVDGDKSQLHHALLNICINSADAILDKGEIEITTKSLTIHEPEEMRLRSLETGDYVKITVRDTGIGIDEDILPKVFNPFFTTKAIGSGTGLGLAMVYGVVQNHGGITYIDSVKGHGTIVTIVLPVGDGLNKSIDSMMPAPPISRSKDGGILLVDDEAIIRTSARRLMEKLGYNVFLAENGEVALDLYKKHRDHISLIVLDMIMPVMDGEETFYALKELNPNVKILLSSGYAKDNKIEKMLSIGALGFIQKPFDIWMFSDSLKSLT